jgi:hypothetical protein
VAVLTKKKLAVDLRYRILESVCKTEGAQGATVYGIEVERNCGEYREYAVFEDVSTDMRKVYELISLLSKNVVPPDQLQYIIEDSIGIYI